jgi:hypothetical protein
MQTATMNGSTTAGAGTSAEAHNSPAHVNAVNATNAHITIAWRRVGSGCEVI